MPRALLVLGLLPALACSDDPRSVGLFGSADGGSASAETGGATAGDTADPGSADAGQSTQADDTAEGDDDDGPILDVGPGADSAGDCIDGGPGCGCNAVDILFVIDNSGSMCLRQEALAAAFPGFTEAIGAALPPGTDLHVGITTSGFSRGGSHSENNCIAQETAQTIDEFFVRPIEGTVDGNGLQGRLFEHEGQRWFEVDTADADGMAALDAWFSGAATAVDCGVSSFEFNAAGAAWALHPDNAATNAGFLRDEGAALVLFVLSDEADQSLDVESIEFLHDTVVAAKAGCGGDACIVGGGMFSQFCTPDLNAAHAFLSSFGTEPIWGNIGLGIPFEPPPDYAGVLGDALASALVQTCESIPPAG